MKKRFVQRFFGTIIFLFLGLTISKAQFSFTLPSTACSGSSQTLGLISGSTTALSNTWTAFPAGPVFSAPNGTITTITFPTAGVYTIAIAAINSSGLAYFTNTITILTAPSLTVSQNSQTTCITSNYPSFSKPVHLSALGATNYTWYPLQPPPIIPGNNAQIDTRPSSSTCYTVVGNTAGCVSSETICITVIPQFSMDVNPFPAVRCLPDSLKLSVINIQSTAVGPFSAWTYSWTEPHTSTLITMSGYFSPTVSVFPSSSITYTSEVIDSRQCISIPKVVSVSVQTCTGIQSNVSNTNGIRVFPNPVLEEMYWSPESENIKIEYLTLTNTLGQSVLFINNPKAKEKIDLRFLAKGIYYLKFFREEEQKVVKLIKD